MYLCVSGVETKFKNCYYSTYITPLLIPEMNEVKVLDDGVEFGGAVNLTTIGSTIDELKTKLPGNLFLHG